MFTPPNSWNIAKVGVKHQSINQSINKLIKSHDIFSTISREDLVPVSQIFFFCKLHVKSDAPQTGERKYHIFYWLEILCLLEFHLQM